LHLTPSIQISASLKENQLDSPRAVELIQNAHRHYAVSHVLKLRLAAIQVSSDDNQPVTQCARLPARVIRKKIAISAEHLRKEASGQERLATSNRAAGDNRTLATQQADWEEEAT